MKAAIPVPYIIALIFGVIAIAILGYWLYTQSGKSTSRGVIGECDAKKLSFCQAYKTMGYAVEPLIDFPTGCNEPGVDVCINLLGGCKGTVNSPTCGDIKKEKCYYFYTKDSCECNKATGCTWVQR